MKKLTAGIFVGILTIVTVNAADAAIASKAYVDQQRDAVAANVTSLTTVVGATENEGLRKDVADLKSSMGEGGSVADQIATALGEDFPENTNVAAQLALKADKATTYTKTEAGETFATKTALETTDEKVDANATAIETLQEITTGLTAAKVTQITTNTDDIAGINTTLNGKQATLDGTNVKTNGTGNVITSISAANGVVTAETGDMFPAVPATQTGEDGTLVLTAKIVGGNVAYAWESIERGTSNEPGAGGATE